MIAVLPYTVPRQVSWHGHVPSSPAMPTDDLPRRWIRLDPNLRGRVTPETLAAIERRGLTVHRVGGAAHVHDAERRHRWILAVVPHGPGAVPAFVARLDDHHRWIRRRGGAPLPRDRARLAAFTAAFRERADRDAPWHAFRWEP